MGAPLFKYFFQLRKMEPSGTYYNLETLRLTTDGDQEFENILIATFCEEAPGLVRQMREAHVEGDLESMGRFAHSLKPNAQMFGIESIRETILFVENAGRNTENHPDLQANIAEIEKVIALVVNELQ